MKKLLTFLFTLCLGFAVHAQGVYTVTGQVMDANIGPVEGACGFLEYTSDCDGTWATVNACTDADGFFTVTIETTCTQGSIIGTFFCDFGTVGGQVQGSYFPNGSQSVELPPVVMDCGSSNSCSAEIFADQVSETDWVYIVEVAGGTAPYSYSWYVNGSQATGANGDVYTASFNAPGVYDVCVAVVDANGMVCESCTVTEVTTGNSSCTVGFGYSTDASTGVIVADAFANGTSTEYEYTWTLNNPTFPVTYTGNPIQIANVPDGTYFLCVVASGVNGDECEYCEEVVIGGGNNASCQTAFEVVDGPNGTLLEAYTDGTSASYVYEWFVNGNIGNPSGTNSNILDMTTYAPGVYSVCVVAYGDNNVVCEYCQDVTIGEVPPFCEVIIDATYTTNPDSTETWVFTANVPIDPTTYTYEWSIDGTPANIIGESFTGTFPPGVYVICVQAVGADGSVCESCYTIEVLGGGGNNPFCETAFEIVNTPNGTLLEAFANGSSSAYIYEWYVDGVIASPNSNTGNVFDMTGYPSGGYDVCVVAYGNDGSVCEYCLGVVIQDGNPVPCDGLQAGYIPGDFAPWWTVYVDGVLTTDVTFSWDLGSGEFVDSTQANSPQVDVIFPEPGVYVVCVSVIDLTTGEVLCTLCFEVPYNIDNPGCWVIIEQFSDPAGGTLLEAFVGDPSLNYEFEWIVSNGDVGTGNVFDMTGYPDGTYDVCVIATTTDGAVCEYCSVITIGNSPNCWVTFDQVPLPDGTIGLEAFTQGGTAPYTYLWQVDGTIISDSNVADLANLPPGEYFVCVTVTDANGAVCEYCDWVFTGVPGPGDGCLDWTVIDLTEAPCTMDYVPVCGCDGITYENECIAYYCFGVTEWTAGPCDYSGGDGTGTGGNTGGTSPDPACDVSAEFFYYGELNANGDFDLFFFGFGVNTDELIWTFSDGTTYTGDFVQTTISSTDSLQAYTVCLTTISWGDSCTATLCETIVLDDTPNGYIGGTVVDGGNLWEGGEIFTITSAEGDPLADITVELLDPAGMVIQSTTTDVNGNYSFDNLIFGDYFVKVNIAGVPHVPFQVTLDPVVQTREEVDFGVTTSGVSGTNEVSFASDILLSPNPTDDHVNINLSLVDGAEMSVIVRDMFGKEISRENQTLAAGRQTLRVELTDLPQGMYMVSLQSNGEVYTEKVLKQ